MVSSRRPTAYHRTAIRTVSGICCANKYNDFSLWATSPHLTTVSSCSSVCILYTGFGKTFSISAKDILGGHIVASDAPSNSLNMSLTREGREIVKNPVGQYVTQIWNQPSFLLVVLLYKLPINLDCLAFPAERLR